jgi:hypothetical protein
MLHQHNPRYGESCAYDRNSKRTLINEEGDWIKQCPNLVTTNVFAIFWFQISVLLPYVAQLAKVFSQGNYYVGGPRKVQICRNCLFTNTLIMCFCLFIVVTNCCLSRTINVTWAPVCSFTVTVSTRECLACFFTLHIQYPSMYWNNPIGRDSNLEYPIGRI